MPRFFFHLRTDRGLETDSDGVEFSDLDRAIQEAHRAVPGMAADFLTQGRDPMDFCFQITGEDGALLHEFPFRAVLRPGAFQPPGN